MLQQLGIGEIYNETVGLAMAEEQSTVSQRVRIDRFLCSVQNSGYRMAHLATSHREDALELVQESMLQLVKSYSDRPDNELKILFYRILSSRITDWYRKTAFRKKFQLFFSNEQYLEGDPIQELCADYQLPLSDQLDNSRMIRKLTEALIRLSKRQRQTFLLRAWQGFNVKDTAEIMGCSAGSVKTHYSRALQALKALLGDQYEG